VDHLLSIPRGTLIADGRSRFGDGPIGPLGLLQIMLRIASTTIKKAPVSALRPEILANLGQFSAQYNKEAQTDEPCSGTR
jgi:hypothetical protein